MTLYYSNRGGDIVESCISQYSSYYPRGPITLSQLVYFYFKENIIYFLRSSFFQDIFTMQEHTEHTTLNITKKGKVLCLCIVFCLIIKIKK